MSVTRTKRDLMNSLLDLLKTKDYNAITISEICQSAGYNRGTFYNNFNNKDDLLDFLIDTNLSQIVHEVNQLYSFRESDYLVLPLFEVIHNNGEFFQSLLNNNTIVGFRAK